MDEVVIDASAMVDLLLGGPMGDAVAARVASRVIHGPAHLDAESLSALGRLHRAGELTADAVGTLLNRLAGAPVVRHPIAELLAGAWARRSNLRLADALYVELASTLGLPLVTTDARLRPVPLVDVVAG